MSESQIGQPGQNDKRTPSNQGEADKKAANSPAISPSATPEVGPAPKNTDRPKQENKGFFDRNKTKFEAVAIIGGLILIGINFFQWQEMRTERFLSERAWISIEDINFHYSGTNENQLSYVIHFKNTGQTPALNFQLLSFGGQNFGQIPVRDIQPTSENPYTGMVGPGEDIFTTSFTMQEGILKAIRAGAPYYVFGTVWYDDIFGNHHWSQFCFQIATGSDISVLNALPIGKHNSCDDMQKDNPK